MASRSNTEKGNSEKLENQFILLRSNALNCGVSSKQLHDVIRNSASLKEQQRNKYLKRLKALLSDPSHTLHISMLLLATSVGFFVASYQLLYDYVRTTPCLVNSNLMYEEIRRPRVNCDMCIDIDSVPSERNLSSDKFYKEYAFTGRPVLVKEGTQNWTAMTQFSFKFFQKLYRETPGALEAIKEDCQFFPYETEFLTLADALDMSDERAAFKPGEKPWYIGWSNCHAEVGKVLRQHYQRPYFLPVDSETVAEDWIFMGVPGHGAGLHLDYVERPSWQAQISGQKTWKLVPSPECQSICQALNVTVHKGDIIVLDTNIWYHSTTVHPGEISISIGSEFD